MRDSPTRNEDTTPTDGCPLRRGQQAAGQVHSPLCERDSPADLTAPPSNAAPSSAIEWQRTASRRDASSRRQSGETSYWQFPIAVSPEFRAQVLAIYPALASHENAVIYRRIFQHLLFSTFLDTHSGKVILSREIVAALAGVPHKTRGFSAQKWIRAFRAPNKT